MSGETGGWIAHDGEGFPVRAGELVEAVARGLNGWEMSEVFVAYPCQPAWYRRNFLSVSRPGYRTPLIVRYRVLRPRALQHLIELVETLPAPHRESEDA